MDKKEYPEENLEPTTESEKQERSQMDGIQQIELLSNTLAIEQDEEAVEDPKNYVEELIPLSIDNRESVVLNSGSLGYTVTDFVLPGKNGFDLSITRKYDSGNANTQDLTPVFGSEEQHHYTVTCDYMQFKYIKGYSTSGASVWSTISVNDMIVSKSSVSKIKFDAEIDGEDDKEKQIAFFDPSKGGFASGVRFWLKQQLPSSHSLSSKYSERVEHGATFLYEYYLGKIEPRNTRDFRVNTQGGIFKNVFQSGLRENDHGLKTYGLGYGWSFQLPSIEVASETNHKEKVEYNNFLHLPGRGSFHVEKSGVGDLLKDYPLKDIILSYTVGTLGHPLHSGSWAYHAVVAYKNGSADYLQEVLDWNGKVSSYKITGRKDRFGNTIIYQLADYGGMTVIDTWGRVISLIRDGNSLHWTFPDNSKIEYMIENNTLARDIDQLGRTTTYAYADLTAESKFRDTQYGDTTKSDITYRLLTEVAHPNGLTTKYIYGNNADNTGLSIDLNYQGGYRRVFPLYKRGDYIGTVAYKSKTYFYQTGKYSSELVDGKRKKYEGFIQSATVLGSGTKEVHTFNRYHQLIEQDVYTNNKLTEKNILAYGTGRKAHDYKLPLNTTALLYSAEQSGTAAKKETVYTYSVDFKANLVQEKTTFWNSTGVLMESQIQDMEYDPNFSLLTKKTYKKDDTTIVMERYTLSSDSKVIAMEEVLENNVLVRKKRLLYEEFQIAELREYPTAGSESKYLSTNYAYGAYSSLPVKTWKTGIVDADGRAIPSPYGAGIWQETSEHNWFGQGVSHTDANGRKTVYSLDAIGRKTREEYPDKSAKAFVYNNSLNQAVVTDENGCPYRYEYTPLGKIQQIVDVTTNTLLYSFSYDSENRILQEKSHDSSGTVKLTIEYAYDSRNRVTKKTTTGYLVSMQEDMVYSEICDGWLSRETKTVHGDSNSPAQISVVYTDPLGNVRVQGKRLNGNDHLDRFTYDKLGNQITVQTALDASKGILETIRRIFDLAGNVLSEKDSKGNQIRHTYDDLGRNLTVQDKRSSQQEAGYVTKMMYDAFGRVIRTEVPIQGNDVAVTRIIYDMTGNVVKQLTPWANGSHRTTEFTYDLRNRLVDTIAYDENGRQNRTRVTYDAKGNKLNVYIGMTGDSLSGTHTTSYAYDRFGNVTACTDAMTQVERYSYDATGLLLSKKDRKGSVFAYFYDALSRIVGETVRDSDGTVLTNQVVYTRTGQKQKIENATLSTTFFYDELGRMIREVDSDGATKEYGYDLGSNRAVFSLTVGGSRQISEEYRYNELGQLTEMLEGGVQVATYSYDANGNRATLSYPNGLFSHYEYNRANWMTSLSHRKNGVEFEKWTYAHTLDGNIVQKNKTTSGRTLSTNYSYNALGQLICEDYPIGGSRHYSIYEYDRYTNRIGMKIKRDAETTFLLSTTYGYDSNNRMTDETIEHTAQSPDLDKREAKEDKKYEYDANGNQINMLNSVQKPASHSSIGSVGFLPNLKSEFEIVEASEYNGFNQLILTHKDGIDSTYAYKPDGLRHHKTVSGKTTTHIWDGQNIVLELNDGRTVKGRYLRGVGLLARVQDGNRQYYLHDAHGDVTHLANTQGIILRKYEYDAFGNETAINDKDSNPFRYCGEYYDKESKTIYLRARSYNPRTGRFTSEDTIKDGNNWYAYCGGNPVKFIDPSGKNAIAQFVYNVAPIIPYVDGDLPFMDLLYGALLFFEVVATQGDSQIAGTPSDKVINALSTVFCIREVNATETVYKRFNLVGKNIFLGKKSREGSKGKEEAEPDVGYDLGGESEEELDEVGDSNTYQDQRDKDTGELKQRRYYGEDGRTVKDTDFNHGGAGSHKFPHDHYWDWSKPKSPQRYNGIPWD